MKIYDVEMAVYYAKTLQVKAPNREAAEALVETIFKDTNALKLTPDDLEDFEAFATPIDGTDDDDDYDCFCEDFDEDEEFPFDADSDHQERLLEIMQNLLDSLSDKEVTLHISPVGGP